MNLALAVALALVGQFSQIDTDGNGTPNIYRWLSTAEWRVGGAGTGFAGTSGQCLMSGGPAASPAWGSCLAAGSAYSTVQEEGVAVTPRAILNFIGASVTAVDNLGTRTNVTLSQSPVGSTSVVGTGRLITSGNGLTGGADLTADMTLNVGAVSPITVAADSVGFDQTVALGNVARTTIRENTGADVGSRRRLNLIEGAGISLTTADDAGNEEVDITIAATGGGTGDVVGPASAADEAICRYDTTTGKLIQNSGLLLDNSGFLYRAAAAGTDQPGTDIRASAGAGTGAGQPGVFWVGTPSVLGSGSTVQTVIDRLLLGGQTTSTTLVLGNPDIDTIVAVPVTDVTISGTNGSGADHGSDVTVVAGATLGNGRGGDLLLNSGSTFSANPDRAGDIVLTAGDTTGPGQNGAIRFVTVGGGTIERMTIQSNIITLDTTVNLSLAGDVGTAGQVLTSGGSGSPLTWETPSGGAGGGGAGSTTVNFGAFPGSADAAATITGQATIGAGSIPSCWIYPVATADNTVDDHQVAPLTCFAHTIVVGTGFTCTCRYTGWAGGATGEPTRGGILSGSGGSGPGRSGIEQARNGEPMASGLFTIGWRWQ